MTSSQVIVAGEGPAGLMAAGQAAARGAETLLLAKMDRPGYKLRLTGNRRCNLTNLDPLPEFIKHFRPDGRFLRQSFSQFFSSDLITFFERLGVPVVTEQCRFVFPASGRALDVVDALVRWIGRCGVDLRTLSPVDRLIVDRGRIVGVQLSPKSSTGKYRRRQIIHADAVIIATGGASYPSTGSTGDGYRLAESVGHNIVPIRPALVPLETAGDVAPGLQGLSLSDVNVRVFIDGKKRMQKCGEILFTHFGLSGPVILSFSGQIVDALRRGCKVEISIDLFPNLDESRLDERLIGELTSHGKQKFRTVLKTLLPAKLTFVCVDLTGISAEKLAGQITASQRKRLGMWLKDFRLEVTGYRPLAESIVTAGGVDTRQIDPRTMASRLVKGLYFAGEVLDFDGDSGGYNLQAAFSTGCLAGRCAAAFVHSDRAAGS